MNEISIVQSSSLEYENSINNAIAQATSIIEEYNSSNSKRAFKGDIAYWNKWVNQNQIQGLIRKEHVILFIMQHAGTHKISTIERRLGSMSRYLHLNKIDNPCRDKDIQVLLRKLTEKHGKSKSWGKAITLDILNDMLKTCHDDGIIGTRDYALLLFGFSTGGRRRSEISKACMENLSKNSEGNFVYNLKKSKTNQLGEDDQKPIAGRAAIALMNWLERSGVKEGAIFRSMRKGGGVLSSALCDMQISRIIKSRCKKAGYDPKEYTAHSLRSGFITEGGKRGKPIGDIMAMSGHKSLQTAMKYYKSGDILNNSAAYLAG